MYYLAHMRKLVLSLLLSIGFIGSSFAQMAIPGAAFVDGQARFNGRKVTVKNLQLDFSDNHSKVHGFVGPVGAPANVNVGPGPVGSPTAPTASPCNPPRGFKKLNVVFLERPEANVCFFMMDAMYDELKRQSGNQAVDAQITFRGDSRVGYNVTFYKLGR